MRIPNMRISSYPTLLLFIFSCTFIAAVVTTNTHSYRCKNTDICENTPSSINYLHVSNYTSRHLLLEHNGKNRHAEGNVGKWILCFFTGGFAGMVSGLVISLIFKAVIAVINGGRAKANLVIYSKLVKKKEYLSFLENDNEVEKLEVIGRGGCGVVFRAPLDGAEGKYLAIKKVNQPCDGDVSTKMRQIQSEIETVGHIRHKNLLPLLAHVARSNCHYLVYEYMKNGSLQNVLRAVAEGKRELTWPTRYRIALEISSGLEYLHSQSKPRIIHRDLKPANVLLNDDMEAKIADFGMAKAMPHAHTHVTSSNVAGTVGYIAPEYHQTLKFTEKCDVYGFGVVLGALVGGREPSDVFFQETSEMSMVRWMRNTMAGEDPTAVIDGKLRGNGFEEQMLMVMKVACFCTLDNPKERPNSKQAKHMLSQIC